MREKLPAVPSFLDELMDLFASRRDVRRFQKRPIPAIEIEKLKQSIALAPSVGLSEPWRIISVESIGSRQAIYQSYLRCNEAASHLYQGPQQTLYRSLKLAGLQEAPVQLAFYVETLPTQGHGLGIQSMPESLEYSVVAAIQNLWLAARDMGIGVGWVSIIDPTEIRTILNVPPSWKLVAYLCIGYPMFSEIEPELQTCGWESRKPIVWLSR